MSDSELATELYAYMAGDWMEVSMNALAIFEYVTTFDQEISAVWKRKRSGATLLLFAVRYTMLCTAILSVTDFGTLEPKECTGVLISTHILVLLGDILTAAFSALRLYALSGGSVILSAAVFFLQLSPFVVNAYGYARTLIFVDPTDGCVGYLEYSLKTQNILVLVSRIPLTIGDALVVIVTWMKSFQQLRIQHRLGVQFSLSTLMFRDGAVYFLLLFVLNILVMCPLTASTGGYVIGALSGNLPLILVNRFMLNLRQLSDSEARSADNVRTISTPVFQVSLDIAGNMGEPLEHGWEARGGVEVENDEVLLGDEAWRGEALEMEELRRDVDEVGPSRHRSA